MKYTLVLFFFFCLFENSFSQPLSGTYTIGGSSPDYPSVANAVNQLNTLGVGEGGVEFLIRPGTYSVPFTITAQGTFNNQIVFRSEDNSPESVVLTAIDNDDIITLDGTKYVTFNAITVRVQGSNTYSAFEITDDSDNISITSCHLNGSTSTGSSYAGAAIYSSESNVIFNCDSILVSNCLINGGTYGLALSMGGTGANSIILENNRFENQAAGGVYYSRINAPIISNNNISTNQTSNTGYVGIDLNNCPGPGRIINNYIYSTNQGRLNYGIQLNSSPGNPGDEFYLVNNSIQVQNENSLCYALAQSNNCNNYKIFHNTLFVSSGNSSGSTPYQTFTFNADTDFYNNILISSSDASTNRCVYIGNESGIGLIEYNVYWTANAGSNFTGYYGGVFNDFPAFSGETGEMFSLNIDPIMTFIEEGGWRANNELLLTTGLFVSNYNSDIDGNTRPDPPSIGAHEVNQMTTSLKSSQTGFGYHYTQNEVLVFNSSKISKTNSYRLFDLTGRLILSGKAENSNPVIRINRNEILSGLYYLELSDSSNRVKGVKLINP